MKLTRTLLLSTVVASASLTGCASIDKAALGELAGTLVGTYVGYELGDGAGQMVATVLGAQIGMELGRFLGDKLNEADRRFASNAAEAALAAEIRAEQEWRNAETGNSGRVVASDAFMDQKGRTCRSLQQSASVSGESFSDTNTYCLKNGTWKLS